MKNPLGYILLFLLIGIVSGQYLQGIGGIALFVLLTACAMAFTYSRSRYKLSFLLIGVSIVGFILGISSMSEVQLPDQASPVGEVIERKELESGSYRYILKLCDSKDRVYIYDNGYYCVGSVVKTDSKPITINSKRNPVDFDSRLYYRARHIYYALNGSITSVESIHKSAGYFFDRLKTRLSTVYDSILPQRESALVKAMILGDKNDIDSLTYNSYRQSGIVHILCVSGLHISLIGHLAMLILRRWLNRFASIPSTIAVILYCCLSGWSVSAIRAAIMFGIYAIGILIFRRTSVLYSACLAASLLLLYSPCYLYDTGFQYSFTCVIAIGMALELTEYYGIHDRKRQAPLITMAVTLCCKPLTIYHYYTLSLIDVAANVIAVPLLTIVIIFGAVSGIAGLISLGLAKLIIAIPSLIIKLYDIIVQGSLSTHLSELITGGISGYALAGIMICIPITYLVLTESIGKQCLVALLPALALMYRPQTNSVDFLYVGHADCAVVSSGDYTALIDAGSAYNSSYGTRTIVPYIHYLGKERIDEVYISHLDYDHVGGLYDMLGKIEIGKIVAFETDSDKYTKLKQLAEEYSIELVTPDCGEVYSASDGLSLRILEPTDVPTDDNNSSMVMLLEGVGTKVLFTGDIEAKGENNLLNSGYGLSCDVLKLPHHGGKSRKTDALLSASNPSSAIASVGINDRYKHPSEETVSSVKQSGAELYSTADNGTIRVNLDNGSISTYRD